MGLIGADGLWAGQNAQLVLIGDLSHRGPESVNVMDVVMALQKEAPVEGGCVHALLGNHELLAAQRDYRYAWTREVLAFESESRTRRPTKRRRGPSTEARPVCCGTIALVRRPP